MKKVVFLSICALAALGACTGPASNGEQSSDATTVEVKNFSNEQSLPLIQPSTQLIKSADFRFEVSDMKRSTEAIDLSLAKFPGYISSSRLQQQGSLLENKITIRVQSDYFDQMLKELDQLAKKISFRNIQTTDVSKNFVDLESRLKTKREVEQRYMDILRNRTGSIKEVLDAEAQIASLHEEIEATISRLNHLKTQVSYSTINLEMYQVVSEEIVADNQTPFTRKFATAFLAGFEGLLGFLVGLTYAWPILVCGTIAFFVIRYRKQILLRRARV